MPLTLIYGSLETIADSFLYFTSHMGKDQYYSSSAEHSAKTGFLHNTMLSTQSMNEAELMRNWSMELLPTVYYLSLWHSVWALTVMI